MADLQLDPNAIADEEQRKRLRALKPPAVPGAPPTPEAPQAPALKPEIPMPSATPAVDVPKIGAQRQIDQTELNRLKNSPSGIGGIHNRFLRGLARVGEIAGTAFAPWAVPMIPGTEMHHQMLIGQAGRRVDSDIEGEKSQADIEQRQALAEQERSKAKALQTPKPEKPENLDIMIAQASQEAIEAGRDPNTDPKVQQLVGVKHGLAGEKKVTPHINYDSGIPVSVTAPEGVFDVNDPKLPPQYKALVEASQRAHKQRIDEQEASQGRAFAHQGAAQAAAFSHQGASQAATFAQQEKMFQEHQQADTAATKTMQQSAPHVLALSTRVRGLIQQQQQQLGPGASRWQEFMAGKVGAPNPEFTKLRTDIGLLSTLLMRMHVGARGGELMMQHFKDLIDSSKQSPENLLAALDEIDQYAKDVAGHGEGAPQAGSDRVTVISPDGKKGTIPRARLEAYKANGYKEDAAK